MNNLLQNITFFSAVDVDQILRKEVDMVYEILLHLLEIPPRKCLNVVKMLD